MLLQRLAVLRFVAVSRKVVRQVSEESAPYWVSLTSAVLGACRASGRHALKRRPSADGRLTDLNATYGWTLCALGSPLSHSFSVPFISLSLCQTAVTYDASKDAVRPCPDTRLDLHIGIGCCRLVILLCVRE